MLVGYARTSTLEQVAGFEAQIRDLKTLGCEKIFREQASSVGKRAQLDEALDWARDGDTLVVTKLDRLARSVMHLGEIVAKLRPQGRRATHPRPWHRHGLADRRIGAQPHGKHRAIRAFDDA